MFILFGFCVFPFVLLVFVDRMLDNNLDSNSEFDSITYSPTLSCSSNVQSGAVVKGLSIEFIMVFITHLNCTLCRVVTAERGTDSHMMFVSHRSGHAT